MLIGDLNLSERLIADDEGASTGMMLHPVWTLYLNSCHSLFYRCLMGTNVGSAKSWGELIHGDLSQHFP